MTWKAYVERFFAKNTDPQLCLKYWSLLKGEYDINLLKEIGYIEEYTPTTYTKLKCCEGAYFFIDELYNDTICSVCGTIQADLEYTMIGYNEYKNYNFVETSVYKPLEHMRNILREFQCVRFIDNDMIDKIRCSITKITYVSVRKSLLKLGFKQHYLWMPSILNALDPTQFKPLKISSENVRRLDDVFLMYYHTFNTLTIDEKKGRTSLLNYHFVIKELSKILNINMRCKFFQLPKGSKTIRNHKYIWNIICVKNNWITK